MCGIVGAAASPRHQVPPAELARRMCAVIRHRGPDDEGIFHAPQAFLGMRRLAIVDPAGGRQPLYSEDGAVCAVVNGEIYNHRELRRRLEAAGHVFRTNSDAESAVHAYEEYGEEFPAQLRGMFAIALWDERRQSLLLVRDRFGKKPLFFAETPRGLFFASEMKSLLAVPEIDAQLNRDVLADYLLLGYVPTPASMLRGVHKLPPAHRLTYRGGRVSISRYWRLDYAPKLDDDERELADRLEAHIDDAVAVRLNCDVPFGAFLSGGVDSSLVVAMMARHLPQPVQTFSIGFEDAEFNEADDARRVAAHIGTQHRDLIVRPDAVGLLQDIAWYLDEPLADSSAIPTFIVSRLAAGQVKMVLTGDGGDEMFAGYERYARYMQLRAMKTWGLPHVMPLARQLLRGVPGRMARRLRWVASRLALGHPDDYLSGVGLATPGRVRELLGSGVRRPHDYGRVRECFDADGHGTLDTVLGGDVASYLLDDILVKVDRMSMGNSLEARAPLLDQELAAFAARLPENLKLHNGVGKYLLKRVAERYLPADCVYKRKQGFAIPLARWLREDLRELLLDTLHGDAFRQRGAFNVAAVRQLAAEHLRGSHDHSEVLWAVLVFETWAQRFLASSTIETANNVNGLQLASS